MMPTISKFEEDKFYILTGKGEKWSDFDGPFSTPKDAVDHLAKLCDEYASPEIMRSAVLVRFKDNLLDLVRDDNNYSPINGSDIYWKNTIIYKGEILFER
jgi:hypothetical protein